MGLAKAARMNIEISTRCTARCIVCPQHLVDRKNQDMSVEDIMGVIGMGYEIGIRGYHPHLFGEPTMHPRYADLLYMVKEKYPDVRLVNYTNGFGLDDAEIRQSILDNLTGLVISIDGATNETMRLTRPGLDPEKIRRGIRRLYEERLDKGLGKQLPSIAVRMTRMPENEHEADLFRGVWGPHSDGQQIAGLQDFHGFKDLPVAIRGSAPCDRLFYHVVVTVDKDVILCCDDYEAEMILGNLEEASLETIWHGGRMEEVRRLHLEGRSSEVDICSKCSYKGILKDFK